MGVGSVVAAGDSYLVEFWVEGLLHDGCFVFGFLLSVGLQVSEMKKMNLS